MTAAEPHEGSPGGDSIEITVDVSRRRAEALALEVRELAKRYGVEVRCRIGPATGMPPASGE